MSTTSVLSTGSFKGISGFHHKRIAWASIFAGFLVALGIQLLLSLLGIGIGMGAINPLRDHNPMAGLGTGALLWWGITFLLSLFAGSWVSGRLSRTENRFETAIHGILTWVIFVLVNVYILSSAAGSVLNARSDVAGRTDPGFVQNQPNYPRSNGVLSEPGNRQAENDVVSDLSKAGIYSFAGLLLAACIAVLGSTIGRGRNYNDYDEIDANRDRSDYVPVHPASPAIG